MKNGKLGVAMLGPGNIVRRVMTGFHKATNCELIAMASTSKARAEEAQKKYGSKYAFTYEEMLACPEVDLVYIATPHNFHARNAIMCMEAGKHVLCEKPFCVTEKEAREMFECAKKNNVFLMEAMWSRFMPAMIDVMKLIQEEKVIGDVKHIVATMAYKAGEDTPLDGRLYSRKLAGGALMDVGVYAVSFCSTLLGMKPVRVDSSCHLTETGVDDRMAMQLEYANGATAQLMTAVDCSYNDSSDAVAIVYGTEGSIELPEYAHLTRFTVRSAKHGVKEYTYPLENEGHHYQFMHAHDMIEAGKQESPVMTWEESAEIIRFMQDQRYKFGIIYPEDGNI